MKGSSPRDSICLHTEDNGDYWYIDTRGRYAVFDKLDTTVTLRPGVYRVLGCPENYRLITELHSRLSRQEAEAQVYVGAAKICNKRKTTVKEALSCISVLKVHDSLSHQWHAVTSKSFNNYLLLRAYEEEGFSDLVKAVFKHHCLCEHFEFLGVPMHYAIQLMSMIVDPRWFISVNRPMRMQPFETYFGLAPADFGKAWDAKLAKSFTVKSVRTAFLMHTLREATDDCFIRKMVVSAGVKGVERQGCKLLVGYVVRNWLEELGLKGYFDPDKFFGQSGLQAEYCHRFGNT